MRSTPTSVLLSEAGEPPLSLRRSLLSSRFVLRNYSWWGNPLLPRLRLLSERIAAGRLRLLPSRCALLASYLGVLGLVEGRYRSRRASFFDVPWIELTLAVDVNVDGISVTELSDVTGVLRSSLAPSPHLLRYLIYTDGSVDPGAGRAGFGFFVPSLDYRFGVRLPDASSVLFAEFYAIFSAVKYILRMGLQACVILSDSQSALAGIRDRFIDSKAPYIVDAIARLLYQASGRGLAVSFAWIPAHSGIWGNETADSIARSAAGLPFSICPSLPTRDLLTDLRHDFRAWGSRLWPPLGHGGAGSAYFARVGFKSRRPWFRGIRYPRGFINLVTRLRTGHVCTGDHFARMGWNLDADCSCGEEMRSLDHLFLSCPLLSEGRPRLFGYLASRFPGRPPDKFDYRELVFNPDSSVVSELGRFFKLGNIIV